MAIKWNQDMVYWAPTPKLGGGWICHKDGGGSMPATPDPKVTADAQTKSNIETAQANAILNRVNQYTPYGNLTFSQQAGPTKFDEAAYNEAMKQYLATAGGASSGYYDPAGGFVPLGGAAGASGAAPKKEDFMTSSGIPQWSSKVTLAPEQQALLDNQNQAKQALSQMALSQIGNVQKSLATPLDFSKLTPIANNQLASQVTPTNGGGVGNAALMASLLRGR